MRDIIKRDKASALDLTPPAPPRDAEKKAWLSYHMRRICNML